MAYTYNGTPQENIKLAQQRISNDSVVQPTLSNYLNVNQQEQAMESAVAEKSGIERFGDTLGDIAKNVFSGVEKAFEGVADFGASTIGMIAGAFGDNETKQEMSDFVKRDLVNEQWDAMKKAGLEVDFNGSFINDMSETGQNIVRGISQGVGQMLPMIALGAVGGAVGGTAGAALKGAGWAEFGTSAFGGGVETALNDVDENGNPITLDRAYLYGLAEAGKEIGTELLVGGAVWDKGAGVLDKVINNLSKNARFSKLVKYGLNAVGEGVEELVGEAFENTLQTIYKDSNGQIHWENPDTESMIENGVIGSLTAMVLGGGQAAVVKASPKMSIQDAYVNLQENENYAQTMQEKGNYDEKTDARVSSEREKYTSIIENKLSKMSETKRDQFLAKNVQIAQMFDSNGKRISTTLNDGAKSIDVKQAIQNGTFDARINDVNKVSNTIADAQKFLNKNLGKEYKIEIANELDTTQKSNFAKTLQLVKKVGSATNQSLKVVVFDNDVRNNEGKLSLNAFINKDILYINKNNLNTLSDAVSQAVHEITHFEEGTKEYNDLVEYFKKNENDVYLEAMESASKNYSVDQWKSESNARLIEYIVQNDKNGELINRLVRNNSTLGQKVLNKIKDSIKYIEAVLKGDAESIEYYKELKHTEKLFEDAFKVGGTKELYKMVNFVPPKEMEKIENAVLDYCKANNIDINDPEQRKQVPELAFSRAFAADIADDQIKVNNVLKNVTPELLKKAIQDQLGMAAYMEGYDDLLPEDEKVLDKLKKHIVLKGNSSYGGSSVENTTICVRTLAYIRFVEGVQKQLGRPMAQSESFLASQMLYKIAKEPQCLYCYVSLDRKAYNGFLKRYLDEKNVGMFDVVEKYKQMSASDKKIAHNIPTDENFAKKKNDYIKNQSKNPLYADFIRGKKNTENMQRRFAMWLDMVDKGATLLTLKDVATKERMQEIESGNDELLKIQLEDAMSYAQSASWAKKQEDFVAYYDEIRNIKKLSDEKVKELNREFGLRFYSFSDYSPAFLLENMQEITDASIRGLKGLAYTKDLDFVKVFAKTGMNINVSVFVRRDVETGEYYIDGRQSAAGVGNLKHPDMNELFKLREQYENVGIVVVTTDDWSTEWALEQEWSDVVIPFHIVRTGQDVALNYKWKNYKNVQGEKKINSTQFENWIKENENKSVEIFPTEHHNDLQTYLDICKNKGVRPKFKNIKELFNHPNYMKLVNETRLPVDKVKPLQPKFDLEEAKESFDYFKNNGGYFDGYYMDGVDETESILQVARDVERIGKGEMTFDDISYRYQDMTFKALLEMVYKNQKLFKKKHYTGSVTQKSFNGNVDSDGNKLTSAQQSFFEDSKVRDDNGNLQVVYHGTFNDFTIFDKEKSNNAFFFTNDETNAKSYASLISKETRLYKAYLNLTNPLIIDAKNKMWDKLDFGKKTKNGVADWGKTKELLKQGKIKTIDQFLNIVQSIDPFGLYEDAQIEISRRLEKGKSIEEVTKELLSSKEINTMIDYLDNEMEIEQDTQIVLGDYIDGVKTIDVPKYESTRSVVEKAFKDGYDGVIFKNIVDYGDDAIPQIMKSNNVYVAFEPNQIKLTTNEHPTTNDDIRFSLNETDLYKMVDDYIDEHEEELIGSYLEDAYNNETDHNGLSKKEWKEQHRKQYLNTKQKIYEIFEDEAYGIKDEIIEQEQSKFEKILVDFSNEIKSKTTKLNNKYNTDFEMKHEVTRSWNAGNFPSNYFTLYDNDGNEILKIRFGDGHNNGRNDADYDIDYRNFNDRLKEEVLDKIEYYIQDYADINDIRYSLSEREQMFLGKQKYANNKFRENAEIFEEKGLSEQQIDLIGTITSQRHRFHSSNKWFYSESGEINEVLNFLEYINDELSELELPKIENLPSSEDLIDNRDYYEFNLYDSVEDAYRDWLDQKEKINNSIEKWMMKIDKLYGSSIAPTGYARTIQYSFEGDTKNTIKSALGAVYNPENNDYAVMDKEDINELVEEIITNAPKMKTGQDFYNFTSSIASQIIDTLQIERPNDMIEEYKDQKQFYSQYRHKLKLNDNVREILYANFDKQVAARILRDWFNKNGEIYIDDAVEEMKQSYFGINFSDSLEDRVVEFFNNYDKINEVINNVKRVSIKNANWDADFIMETEEEVRSILEKELKKFVGNKELIEYNKRKEAIAKFDEILKDALKVGEDNYISKLKELRTKYINQLKKTSNIEIDLRETKDRLNILNAMIERRDNRINNLEQRIQKYPYEIRTQQRIRKEIRKIKKALGNKIFPQGTLQANEEFQTIIKSIEKIPNMSNAKIRLVAESLQKWYTKENEFFKQDSPNAIGTYDEQIKEMIDDLADGIYDKYGNVSRKRFSLKELKAFNKIINYLRKTIENYDVIRRGQITESAKEVATKSYSTMDKMKGIIKNNPILRGLKKYVNAIIEPRVVIKSFFGFQNNGLSDLYEDIVSGETKMGAVRLEILQPIEDFYKENKKYKDTLSNKVSFMGKQLTKADLITIYKYNKQEHSRGALYESGFGFYNPKTKLWEQIGVLTEESYKELESLLNDTDMKYIKAIEKAMKIGAKYQIETDNSYLGYTMIDEDKTEYYLPIKRYQGDRVQSSEQSFIDELKQDAAGNQSINKKRVKNIRRLNIMPVDQLVMRYADQCAKYTGLAVPISNFEKVLNINIGENYNTPKSIRNGLLEIVSGNDALDYIKNLLMDIQGINKKNGIQSFIGKVRGNYAKFQLGANIKVIMSQMASYPTAFTELDLASMTKAVAHIPHLKEMDQYSEWARVRNAENGIVRAEGIIDNIGKFTDMFTKPIQWTDRLTIGLIWNACQFEVESKHKGDANYKYGTETNKKAAAELLEQIGRKTQPNYTTTERTQLQRSTNEFARTFAMFSAVPSKQLSRLVESLGELKALRFRKKNGESISKEESNRVGKNLAKTITAVSVANIVYVMMGELVKFMFDKDREKDGEEISLGEDVALDFTSTTIGMLPFVKEVYGMIMNGYDLNNADFVTGGLEDMINSTMSLAESLTAVAQGDVVEPYQWNRLLRDFAYGIGQITGMPTRNIYNTIYGITKRFDSSAAYKMNSVFYSTNSYSKDLKKALEDGDTNLANSIVGLMMDDRGMLNTTDVVTDKIRSLYEQEEYAIPRSVNTTITYKDEEYELSASQMKSFKSIYGQANQDVEKLLKSNGFNSLESKVQAKAIKWLYDYYYELAAAETLGIYANSKKILFAESMNPSKFALAISSCSALESDKDKDGNAISGTKKVKVNNLLKKLPLSNGEKQFVLAYLGYSADDNIIKRYVKSLGLTKKQQQILLEYCAIKS